jgi:hypothetical protein
MNSSTFVPEGYFSHSMSKHICSNIENYLPEMICFYANTINIKYATLKYRKGSWEIGVKEHEEWHILKKNPPPTTGQQKSTVIYQSYTT